MLEGREMVGRNIQKDSNPFGTIEKEAKKKGWGSSGGGIKAWMKKR